MITNAIREHGELTSILVATSFTFVAPLRVAAALALLMMSSSEAIRSVSAKKISMSTSSLISSACRDLEELMSPHPMMN